MASADKESLCPKNRLKLLCSYGGKIMPRPSDGQLKYVGGETRVLAVARSISFPELKKRIKEMFNIAEVVIKHQIMPEDLDLLVSVTCDEDLRHMLDEYDRHDSRCPSNSPRFRLFLFSSVPPRLAPFSDASSSSSIAISLFAISTYLRRHLAHLQHQPPPPFSRCPNKPPLHVRRRRPGVTSGPEHAALGPGVASGPEHAEPGRGDAEPDGQRHGTTLRRPPAAAAAPPPPPPPSLPRRVAGPAVGVRRRRRRAVEDGE